MMKHGTKEYVQYMWAHPEEFENQPPSASCGTIWISGILEGSCTTEEMNETTDAIRDRWERYHMNKANSLGFELDIHVLRMKLSFIYNELELAQKTPWQCHRHVTKEKSGHSNKP